MGQTWDNGDCAHDPAFWAEIARVVKPGGWLACCSGTRTYHRLACAIEDGGFEIRDMVAWLYGSGFPKSHDLMRLSGQSQWAGWGTALKPALEPIVLARKPMVGTTAENLAAFGLGGLHIDAGRIDGGPSSAVERRASAAINGAPSRPGEYGSTLTNRTSPERYSMPRPGEALGRWPANVVHDGSDDIRAAFSAFGPRGSAAKTGGINTKATYHHASGSMKPLASAIPFNHGDCGNADRFFYSAKADADGRFGSDHPTVKPIDLMAWIIRLIVPKGAVILDPFAGTGTTGIAALREGVNAILIEREAKFVADIQTRLDHLNGTGAHSMQVKARHRRPKHPVPLFGDL
jgi:site-specific DNA-methyltransferase (adenine-specific)